MPALLLGSISTVADTSELQRQAFNQAFAAHGLDWRWDQDQYRAMLSKSGGQARITDYARSLGQTVDVKAVHETKSRIFQENLGERAGDCIAVEDNVAGVRAAVAAGVRCLAFPNENTAGDDFTAARRRVDRLDAAELLEES